MAETQPTLKPRELLGQWWRENVGSPMDKETAMILKGLRDQGNEWDQVAITMKNLARLKLGQNPREGQIRRNLQPAPPRDDTIGFLATKADEYADIARRQLGEQGEKYRGVLGKLDAMLPPPFGSGGAPAPKIIQPLVQKLAQVPLTESQFQQQAAENRLTRSQYGPPGLIERAADATIPMATSLMTDPTTYMGIGLAGRTKDIFNASRAASPIMQSALGAAGHMAGFQAGTAAGKLTLGNVEGAVEDAKGIPTAVIGGGVMGAAAGAASAKFKSILERRALAKQAKSPLGPLAKDYTKSVMTTKEDIYREIQANRYKYKIGDVEGAKASEKQANDLLLARVAPETCPSGLVNADGSINLPAIMTTAPKPPTPTPFPQAQGPAGILGQNVSGRVRAFVSQAKRAVEEVAYTGRHILKKGNPALEQEMGDALQQIASTASRLKDMYRQTLKGLPLTKEESMWVVGHDNPAVAKLVKPEWGTPRAQQFYEQTQRVARIIYRTARINKVQHLARERENFIPYSLSDQAKVELATNPKKERAVIDWMVKNGKITLTQKEDDAILNSVLKGNGSDQISHRATSLSKFMKNAIETDNTLSAGYLKEQPRKELMKSIEHLLQNAGEKKAFYSAKLHEWGFGPQVDRVTQLNDKLLHQYRLKKEAMLYNRGRTQLRNALKHNKVVEPGPSPLTLHREFEFPIDMLELDPVKLFDDYVDKVTPILVSTGKWGSKLERLDKMISEIPTSWRRDKAQEIVKKTLFGTPGSALGGTSSKITRASGTGLLTGFTARIKNRFLGVERALEATNIWDTAKASAKYYSQIYKNQMKTTAAKSGTMQEGEQYIKQSMFNGWWSNFATGMNTGEWANRSIGFWLGPTQAERHVKTIIANPNSMSARRAMRWLKNVAHLNDNDVSMLLKEVPKGAINKNLANKIGYNVSTFINGRLSAFDLPTWFDGPVAKMATLFLKYAVPDTRSLTRAVTEMGHGNVGPMAKRIAFGIGFGEGLAAIKEALTGRISPRRANLVTRVIDDLMAMEFLSALSIFYATMTGGDGGLGSAIMNQYKSLVENVGGLLKETKSTDKALEDTAHAIVPFSRQLPEIVGNQRAKLTGIPDPENTYKNSRAIARYWVETYRRKSVGTFAKMVQNFGFTDTGFPATKRTPFYQELSQALVSGKEKEALASLEDMYKKLDPEAQPSLSDLKQALKSRRHIPIGKDNLQEYDAYLKKNYPEQYKTFIEADKLYVKRVDWLMKKAAPIARKYGKPTPTRPGRTGRQARTARQGRTVR